MKAYSCLAAARVDRWCPKAERGERRREGEKGKKGLKGVNVKAEREGICSLVSCAGGRESVVGFGVDGKR
jgi:hypothetical protein